MSEYKLASTILVTVAEAKDIIDKFFKAVPKVKRFLDASTYYAQQTLEIATPLGRKRFFEVVPQSHPDHFKQLSGIGRQGANHKIQGANADCLKIALVMLRNTINKHKYPVKIINIVHDEVVTECHKDFAAEWKDIMETTMIKAAQIIIKTIPVKVDCKIMDHWKK